jgi:hypothetical protein
MALKTGVLQAPGAPLPQVHLLISALGLGGRAIMFDPPFLCFPRSFASDKTDGKLFRGTLLQEVRPLKIPRLSNETCFPLSQGSLQHGSLPPMPRNASRQEPEATEPSRQPLIDRVVSTGCDRQQDTGEERIDQCCTDIGTFPELVGAAKAFSY